MMRKLITQSLVVAIAFVFSGCPKVVDYVISKDGKFSRSCHIEQGPLTIDVSAYYIDGTTVIIPSVKIKLSNRSNMSVLFDVNESVTKLSSDSHTFVLEDSLSIMVPPFETKRVVVDFHAKTNPAEIQTLAELKLGQISIAEEVLELPRLHMKPALD